MTLSHFATCESVGVDWHLHGPLNVKFYMTWTWLSGPRQAVHMLCWEPRSVQRPGLSPCEGLAWEPPTAGPSVIPLARGYLDQGL